VGKYELEHVNTSDGCYDYYRYYYECGINRHQQDCYLNLGFDVHV
jgi:hypothetical protein